jgi:hypothetical protein
MATSGPDTAVRPFEQRATMASSSRLHIIGCAEFFGPDDNSLVQDWGGKRVWLNPPFTGGKITSWLKKVCAEMEKGATVVCLLPVWTDRAWWHQYVINAAELRFFAGRPLKFRDGNGLIKQVDLVTCVVAVVFRRGDHRCRVSSIKP